MRKFITIPVYYIEDSEGNPVSIDEREMQRELNAKIDALIKEVYND